MGGYIQAADGRTVRVDAERASTERANVRQADSSQADAPRTGAAQTAAEHAEGQPKERAHSRHAHGYSASKEEYTARLRRIEGQIRGLQRMVAEDKYCIDILTQVSAATRALQSVAIGLLSDHLSHCVAEAVAEGGPAAEEKIREATAAIARLVRS